MSSVRGWRRAWDRITIYLPIILMAVLALATYWLARTTPGAGSGPNAAHTQKHEPDYFLHNFSVKSFEGTGRLKSEIQGVDGRHYPDTDTLEIDQPRIRSYGLNGAVTVATAKHAISNGDGSQVQLIGDAVVTRENPTLKDQPKHVSRTVLVENTLGSITVRTVKPAFLLVPTNMSLGADPAPVGPGIALPGPNRPRASAA